MPEHDLSLARDGQRLTATVVTAGAGPAPGVLLVHGLGSDRRTNVERARALTSAHGHTCLAIDLAGHGSSTGRLSQVTPRQNLADVVAAYDALVARRDVVPSRVGVCGASYGAYLAVLLTSRRAVGRLLLRAPALYDDDCLDLPLSRRRAGGAGSIALDVLAAVSAPVLVVESEHDEVIPPGTVAAYLAARPGTDLRVLPGAAHALTDPAWRADFLEAVLEFFAPL